MTTNVSGTDILSLLREAAGPPDREISSEELADYTFDDLGYDSLALLATAAEIKSQFGVFISDDKLNEIKRPSELLAIVRGSVDSEAS